jgi:hypothetical protein
MHKTTVKIAGEAIFITYRVLLVVGALWFTIACTSGGSAKSSVASQDAQHALFKEWQIIDTATGRTVSLDQWMALLLQQDIIYLGEEHHNRVHIDAALTVLRRLKAGERTPTLAGPVGKRTTLGCGCHESSETLGAACCQAWPGSSGV